MLARLTLGMLALALGLAAPPPTRASGSVPARLQAIEEDAEDAYDNALLGRLAAVARRARSIEGRWSEIRESVAATGATDSLLVAMDEAIRQFRAASDSTGRARVARRANGISGELATLFGLYRPALPPTLLTLDYLGRELELDAIEGDRAAAERDTEALERVWIAFHPTVTERGGTKEAARFDAFLATAHRELETDNSKKLRDAANAGLELVDQLEQVFARAR